MQVDQLKRRAFITLLGGAAVAARGACAAGGTLRRIGVLLGLAADDPEGQARIGAFFKRCTNWGGPTASISNPSSLDRRRR